jgi:hypothetical protein
LPFELYENALAINLYPIFDNAIIIDAIDSTGDLVNGKARWNESIDLCQMPSRLTPANVGTISLGKAFFNLKGETSIGRTHFSHMISVLLRSSHNSAGSILAYNLVRNDVRSKIIARTIKVMSRTNIREETLNQLLGGSTHILKSSLENDMVLMMSCCSIK